MVLGTVEKAILVTAFMSIGHKEIRAEFAELNANFVEALKEELGIDSSKKILNLPKKTILGQRSEIIGKRIIDLAEKAIK